jgi:hypothetical protein
MESCTTDQFSDLTADKSGVFMTSSEQMRENDLQVDMERPGAAEVFRQEVCRINHRENLLALISKQAQMYVKSILFGAIQW